MGYDKSHLYMKEKVAYEKGYRVINGIVFGLQNNILKPGLKDNGYFCFSMITGSRTDKTRKKWTVMVHRLVAYQKFGEKLYDDGIETRHLDGNSENNFDYNISIGTHSDNMLDIPVEERITKAGNNSRKYDHIAIKKYHALTNSYRKTMLKFNLTSKGTLHYILAK